MIMENYFGGRRLRAAIATLTAISVYVYGASASASAEVKFLKSENYADMPLSHHAREDVLKEIQQHFDKLAAKLPQSQALKIEVQDLNLAGRIEPNLIGFNNDVRILRGGADWPSMKFSYAIQAEGKVIKSGSADVSDLNYLRGFNRYSTTEPLRYEKKMLDDWFRKEITDSAQ
jgi:Protein of unknown function (DUF3016)